MILPELAFVLELSLIIVLPAACPLDTNWRGKWHSPSIVDGTCGMCQWMYDETSILLSQQDSRFRIHNQCFYVCNTWALGIFNKRKKKTTSEDKGSVGLTQSENFIFLGLWMWIIFGYKVKEDIDMRSRGDLFAWYATCRRKQNRKINNNKI